jgi:hypothetical protein
MAVSLTGSAAEGLKAGDKVRCNGAARYAVNA